MEADQGQSCLETERLGQRQWRQVPRNPRRNWPGRLPRRPPGRRNPRRNPCDPGVERRNPRRNLRVPRDQHRSSQLALAIVEALRSAGATDEIIAAAVNEFGHLRMPQSVRTVGRASTPTGRQRTGPIASGRRRRSDLPRPFRSRAGRTSSRLCCLFNPSCSNRPPL
jgi:hypothetical protein